MTIIYIPSRWSGQCDSDGVPIIETLTPALTYKEAERSIDDGWVAEQQVSGLTGMILLALLKIT